MTASENAPRQAKIDDTPGLPIEAGEPVFHAPWQAKAFALAVALRDAGLFTWDEWVRTLGATLDAAGPPVVERRAESYAEAYFLCWLSALEQLTARRGVSDAAMLASIAETWKRAAQATPHGSPIRFEAGLAAENDA